ncbi:MAG: ABC transporter ATP-binding protein [Candidatus Eremiobacteraeota bacterium]|nr:ABC transporter ATP-binding protein [Candidatus Eremiobacteraeota bacterium]
MTASTGGLSAGKVIGLTRRATPSASPRRGHGLAAVNRASTLSEGLILLEAVSKRFAPRKAGENGHLALDDVSFDIGAGRFVAVVGPSGCGKSTSLSLIAGLDEPSTGTVTVDGRRVDGVGRNIGFLFQRDALLPWKTVRGNVLLPLVLRGIDQAAAAKRAADWIARVGLRGFEDAWPHHLSGGMRKRAALAQTLVYDPQIVLMDEPFSALDVQTRNLMENELLGLWQGSGKTIVFVTHDLEEAIALADEVVVMTAAPGRVKARYDVPLSRPRNVQEVRFEAAFQSLYEQMWNDLRDEVLESYERSLRA